MLLDSPAMLDVNGRLKTSLSQNIYNADFEYGQQPLRWENFTAGGGSVIHLPREGGCRLSVGTANGDLAIRQSRPYHRYQPGKSMYMATGHVFGAAVTNNRQRVGMFDDGNGLFYEQGDPTPANPSGMGIVLRSDINGTPVDTRVELPDWNGDKSIIQNINWNRIQMLWFEFAWYGAGSIRWGILIDGRQFLMHTIGRGNAPNATVPWSRTGNLPARYEIRNVGVIASPQSIQHYGVNISSEGRVDDQRGFTYSYGMALGTPRRTVAAATTRFPVLSIRNRVMGTQDFTQAGSAITAGTTTSLTVTGTPWTVNQWAGRYVAFGAAGANPTIARIISNTTSALTIADPVTGGPAAAAPAVGNNYVIGTVNQGQILPRRILISSSALAQCELIASTPTSPVVLTGASFAALSSLGSVGSFGERDVSATALTGGEVVMKFTLPAGGSGLQDIDLQNLFPLFNNVRGNIPDILTLAVSTAAATPADVGADFYVQEEMS